MTEELKPCAYKCEAWPECGCAAPEPAAPTKPEPVAPLTHEEASAIAELLRADHDVDDLEPECCLCTAYRKLIAAPTVVEPEPVAYADPNVLAENPADSFLVMGARGKHHGDAWRFKVPLYLAATPPRAPLTDAEIERLRLCEQRLAAVTKWLEANQPDVFRRGLWDAVITASEGAA